MADIHVNQVKFLVSIIALIMEGENFKQRVTLAINNTILNELIVRIKLNNIKKLEKIFLYQMVTKIEYKKQY